MWQSDWGGLRPWQSTLADILTSLDFSLWGGFETYASLLDMGYSGKCLFPWSDIFQIEFRVYGCFSHRPINWLIFLLPKMHTLTLMSTVALLLPINIYLYILFVIFCILNTVHFQGHDPCYKCSRYTCARFCGIWSIATTHSESLDMVYLLTTYYSKCLMFSVGV
jgi:hypothetical protein